jgi:hypothetical protein
LPLIEITTSLRCYLSPNCGARRRILLAQVSPGAGLAECLRPAPHGFIVDDDAERRQQVLDHPQAERKTDREPDSLLDDVRR